MVTIQINLRQIKKTIMKTFFLILIPVMSFCQLKVHSTGNITVSADLEPRGNFDIPINSSENTIAQFGTFGIQSTANGNGFLLANGYYSFSNGRGLYNYSPGGVPMIQFYDGQIILRNTTAPSSSNSLITQENITYSLITKFDEGLGGIVGINTSTPSGYNLYVNGTAFKSSGGSSWAVPSDFRLKDNIKNYKNAISSIEKIQIYEYEYNGLGGTVKGEKSIGVIAQEFKEVFPDMVKERTYKENAEEIENYLTVESGNLIYVLIAAFKDQIKEIKKLKEEIKSLNSQLMTVNSKLNIQDVKELNIIEQKTSE